MSERGVAFPMNIHFDDHDDDLLRHYYEVELEVLRRDLRRFAQRCQGAAVRMSINSDGRSDDPSVERLVQSAALLHARHRLKIDDDYPEFAEALTRHAYPQYLRPVPACAVAQFDIEGIFDSQTEPVCIARGTDLLSKAGGYRFRTGYDVQLAPLQIIRAQYASTPTAPASVMLPSDASGMLSVTFGAAKAEGRLDGAIPAQVRVHLSGQHGIVAALIDTMLLHTKTAFAEDSAGRWSRLPAVPMRAVGAGPLDFLFTDIKEAGQSFAMLAEYFAFADRFHFVDIGFDALRATVPGHEVTLHLIVDRVPPDSWRAQQLAHLRAGHLRLFCTPVVNLFDRKEVALKYDPQSSVWPIALQETDDSPTEVWSVNRVRTEHGKTLPSLAALMSSPVDNALPRWTLTKSGSLDSSNTDPLPALALVTADGGIADGAASGSLRADVTCSNGDLPRTLRCGGSQGDMRMEGQHEGKKIALLQVPTAVTQLSRANGALWRFIDQRTPQPIRLDASGLPALKQILRQFAALSPTQARHIDGITALSHRSVMTMIVREPQPAMVRGIEIALEIDEALFAAHSVAVFAGVMERFFAPYAHGDSFIQLRVSSTSGSRLWSGAPVRGASPLL
jgi:type VI secretion system protein ImpG